SVDVRTVGAGGGSIAHVPELTGALRVGPQSAGADPGPAAYAKGGEEPTVTDANVVLGYLPAEVRLGGDMKLDRAAAEAAVQKIADALGLSLMEAASGIVSLVNENMYGALRLVSVEQGHDPREFALIAFGGAGPLHANALGKLMSSWPVIIPPGPGVLCAYGDATTRVRNEASRTFIKRFGRTSADEAAGIFADLAEQASQALDEEGIPRSDQTLSYQADIRYHGQGLLLTVDFELDDLREQGLDAIGGKFDQMHEQLFTFALPEDKELVNLRAVAEGKPTVVRALRVAEGDASPAAAEMVSHEIYVDGGMQEAMLYDRSKLKAGNVINGPAIVLEMDSTTLVLPGHEGQVDEYGNILITPSDS
ncbi:MAG: hydantoinase/oxoprolinase family protein, partial [Gammaproteobacteria bacterium]|nr:hydantoinase/oxoprolinase family protein [Gammaproteobacteria bacterium]